MSSIVFLDKDDDDSSDRKDRKDDRKSSKERASKDKVSWLAVKAFKKKKKKKFNNCYGVNVVVAVVSPGKEADGHIQQGAADGVRLL